MGLLNCAHVLAGLVATTSRKLDREQQDEHILEVKTPIDTSTDHMFTTFLRAYNHNTRNAYLERS